MTNQANKSTITHPDDMSFTSVQVIAWSCALAMEAVVIVLGNVLTVVLLDLTRYYDLRKVLFWIWHLLICFWEVYESPYMFIPWLLVRLNLMNKRQRFLQLFSSFSLRHHSLPLLWYRWSTGRHFLREHLGSLFSQCGQSILGSLFTGFLLQFSNLVALNSFLCLFFVSVLLIITGRPEIWCLEKDSATTCSSSPKQSLAKTTLNEELVLSFLGYRISNNISLITFFTYFSNSFINPIVYALRIPDFKEALSLCCYTRHEVISSQENAGRDEMAAHLAPVIQKRTLTMDHNNLKLTFEQENVEDTKLWYTTEEQQ